MLLPGSRVPAADRTCRATEYAIHPDVLAKLPKDRPRIADVGTGTGVWLVEAAKSLPPSADLRGFDISSDQFPSSAQLPSNIALDVLNAKQEPPKELHGTFDLVHLRLLLAVMHAADWKTVASNIMKLLKPGGAIQWGEPHMKSGGHFRNGAKAMDIKKTAMYKLRMAFLDDLGHMINDFGLDTFERAWTELCMQDISTDIVATDRDASLRKSFTETTMGGHIGWARTKAKALGGQGFWTEEEVDQVDEQIQRETEDGEYCTYLSVREIVC